MNKVSKISGCKYNWGSCILSLHVAFCKSHHGLDRDSVRSINNNNKLPRKCGFHKG